MLGCRFSFEAYAKNVREKVTKCPTEVLRFYWMLVNICSPKFDIKVQQLQTVLRATETLDVLIFFKKMFCLMSDLKFTLSDITSFLPDSESGLKKLYSGLIHFGVQ